jgi:hypothetical protein
MSTCRSSCHVISSGVNTVTYLCHLDRMESPRFTKGDLCTTAPPVISRSECDEKSYLFQSLKISSFGRNDKKTSCAKVSKDMIPPFGRDKDFFTSLRPPLCGSPIFSVTSFLRNDMIIELNSKALDCHSRPTPPKQLIWLRRLDGSGNPEMQMLCGPPFPDQAEDKFHGGDTNF